MLSTRRRATTRRPPRARSSTRSRKMAQSGPDTERRAVMSIAGRVKEQPAGWVREQIAYVRGLRAYAYGFPLVIMDLTRQVMTAAPRSGEYSAPINQFHRPRDFVSPDFKNCLLYTSPSPRDG